MFTNGLIMGLSLQACVKKTVYRVKTHWLSSNEKVPSAAISNENNTLQYFGTWKDSSLLISLKKKVQL